MERFLILRLDAPLMSFGGVAVDALGVTRRFPARSMITGLLANALGYDHRDANRLQVLQKRLVYAVRCDREPERLIDYQTVDLGQDFMMAGGWTTEGRVEERGGGTAREGTHIRERHYLADAIYTVALTLRPPDHDPDLDRLITALREPERPLFLGRKACIPSAPVLVGETHAFTLIDALRQAPLVIAARRRSPAVATLEAWWPTDEGAAAEGEELAVCDERDWANQIHVGRRFLRHGPLPVQEGPDVE